MKKTVLVAAVAALMTTSAAVTAGPAATVPLTVEVDGVRNSSGVVIVALFDQPAAFQQMDVKRAVAFASFPANADKLSVTLHNLPKGNYAAAVMHDEDIDGNLDMQGQVPTEGYAFAGMGSKGLPPAFDKASVSAGANAKTTLRLKYWK